MDTAAWAALFGDLADPIAALALASARPLGVMAILPVFARLGATGLLKGGIALALALPLLPVLTPQVAGAGALGPFWLVLLAKEALVGVLIGFVFGIPFWAAEAAGEIIDQQLGSESALIPDPSHLDEAGITATLFGVTLITIFFASGGMALLVEAKYASLAIWPPLDPLPRFSAEAGLLLLGLLDRLMRVALIVAGPVLLALLLAEIALAFIGRVAPQLDIFDLSHAIKGLVYIFALPVYAVFLLIYLRDGLAPLLRVTDELRLLAP